jgi:hypothetical protein
MNPTKKKLLVENPNEKIFKKSVRRIIPLNRKIIVIPNKKITPQTKIPKQNI